MVGIFCTGRASIEIYTLSLHDALPILADARKDAHAAVARKLETPRHHHVPVFGAAGDGGAHHAHPVVAADGEPRSESTRLNSSHMSISYAVFCLKKKKRTTPTGGSISS